MNTYKRLKLIPTICTEEEARFDHWLYYTGGENRFNQCLAGIIDGIEFLSAFWCSLRVPHTAANFRLIQVLHQRYGSCMSEHNFCTLTDRDQLIRFINDINGLIRTKRRKAELEEMCKLLGIIYLAPEPDSWDNRRASGLLYSIANISCRQGDLAVEITLRNKCDLNDSLGRFTGDVKRTSEVNRNSYDYEEKDQPEGCILKITTPECISLITNYCVGCPLQSIKSAKIALFGQYYELKKLKTWKKHSVYHSA